MRPLLVRFLPKKLPVQCEHNCRDVARYVSTGRQLLCQLCSHCTGGSLRLKCYQ